MNETTPRRSGPRLYNVAQIGAELGELSRAQVYRLMASGQLRWVQHGRNRMCRPEDLDDYVASLPVAASA